MSWINEVGTLLQKYGQGSAPQSSPEVENHFGQVAQAVPSSQLSQGITEAFRSDTTPPFQDMVSHLFGQSNSVQKAGILNTLLQARANVRQSILARLGLGGSEAAGQTTITPEQAESIQPDVVRDAAAEAHNSDPTVIDRAGEFYAQHPSLVKTVGSAALAIMRAKVAKNAHVM